MLNKTFLGLPQWQKIKWHKVKYYTNYASFGFLVLNFVYECGEGFQKKMF